MATGAAINSIEDVAELVSAGITDVIDCRDDFDDAPLFALSRMRYLWNGTSDDGQHKPAKWFDDSIDFALHCFGLERGFPKVYVHCAAGVNRGPSTAYAIMRAMGWTAEQAEFQIRAVRPQVGLAYKADADAAILDLYGV